MAKKSSTLDKKWQAEMDAHTLAQYQEIMADKKRMNAAMKQAKAQAEQLERQATAMKKAYGGKLKRR